jgi:hypothetical protein
MGDPALNKAGSWVEDVEKNRKHMLMRAGADLSGCDLAGCLAAALRKHGKPSNDDTTRKLINSVPPEYPVCSSANPARHNASS